MSLIGSAIWSRWWTAPKNKLNAKYSAQVLRDGFAKLLVGSIQMANQVPSATGCGWFRFFL
jgi:hypothetical protein